MSKTTVTEKKAKKGKKKKVKKPLVVKETKEFNFSPKIHDLYERVMSSDIPNDKKAEYIIGLLSDGEKFSPPENLKFLPYSQVEPRWCDTDVKCKGIEPYVLHYILHGWTTIPVMSREKAEEYRGEMWKHMESMKLRGENIGMRRDDVKTWTKWGEYTAVGMLGQSLNHSEMHWKIREMCHKPFSRIWRDKNLLVSYDGANFFPPTKSEVFREWFHCDRSRIDDDKYNQIQGQVVLTESGEKDGGLVLITTKDPHPKAYESLWYDYLQKHKSQGYGRFDVDANDSLIQGKGHIIKVCAPAGSLILWNSKIIHCNAPPQYTEGVENERFTLYVSMHPRKYATSVDLQKRVEGYERGWVSGHVCVGHQCHPRPPVSSCNFPSVDTIIPAPATTPLRRMLIGYPLPQ